MTKKKRRKILRVHELPDNPISALEELANAEWLVPRPTYDFRPQGHGWRVLARYRDGIHAWGEAPSRQAAKQAAAAGLLAEVLKRLCPTPNKMRFATTEAAWDFIHSRQAYDDQKVCRVYDDCKCGWIHIASTKDKKPKVKPV